MANEPIYFFQGDQVGFGPAQAKKTITWIGAKPKYALLEVHFQGKLGWELVDVDLNGRKYVPKVINQYNPEPTPNDMYVHVADNLINGDNVLTVNYLAPPIGTFFGERTTLTVKLHFVPPDLAPGIENPFPVVGNLPSLDLIAEDIDKRLANATIPTIIIMVAVALIAIAIAVVVSKLGGIAKVGSLIA